MYFIFLDEIIENVVFLVKHNINRTCVLLPNEFYIEFALLFKYLRSLLSNLHLRVSCMFCRYLCFSYSVCKKSMHIVVIIYFLKLNFLNIFHKHERNIDGICPFLNKTPSVKVSRNSRQNNTGGCSQILNIQ